MSKQFLLFLLHLADYLVFVRYYLPFFLQTLPDYVRFLLHLDERLAHYCGVVQSELTRIGG